MATIEGLPDGVREFIERYRWHAIDPVPWARPKKPLPESCVGLVVMACMTAPDQPPFQAEQPGNDPTLRILPSATDPASLVNTYPGQAFDHAGLREDPNLLVPIDRLREMAELGEIGGLTDRVVSMCGHIVNPRPLQAEYAPEAAAVFAEDGADVVMLVPA